MTLDEVALANRTFPLEETDDNRGVTGSLILTEIKYLVVYGNIPTVYILHLILEIPQRAHLSRPKKCFFLSFVLS